MPEKTELKCSIHNIVFEKPSDYYKHENEFPHTHSGSGRCADCGCRCDYNPEDEVVTKIEGDRIIQPQPRCRKCQEKLEKQVIAKLKKEEKI